MIGRIISAEIAEWPYTYQKGGVRELHWHANAAELSYCVTGNAKMTIYGPNARRDTFAITPGQLTFVPKLVPKLVIVYNNECPEDLGVSGFVGSMSARVLDRSFGISFPGFFNHKSSQDVIIGQRPAIFSSSSTRNLDYKSAQI